ncbi:ClpP/crotonase-like domain-containing protein [Calycina marina]|uniref:ClpP/crotonase-like domain-containing protein n=1 Tax=Calycina marina TaxID=1763456 RepID=A0A9P7YXN0_9HELO|nr:ClpP/crotonase-like domain-containing protein [Calycina marina]
MRSLLRPLPSTLPRIPRRYYSLPNSGQSTPLMTVTDVAAPSSGRIRILSLTRPSARNAISRQMLWELRSHIDAVAAEYNEEGEEKKQLQKSDGKGVTGATRVLVLASDVDDCFCAGADLKERAGFTADETNEFLAKLRDTFTTLSMLPIPTVSAVSSLALGGGLELALCTTMRVLASTAQIGLPETRLGIIPGAGGTYRLPALIGLGRARDMILTGRRVSAAEAYFLGLADRLVEVLPDEKIEEEKEQKKELKKRANDECLKQAVILAGQICEGGPIAVRAALKAVGWAREDVENKMYEKVVDTNDRHEALKAFREKRLPVFTGR